MTASAYILIEVNAGQVSNALKQIQKVDGVKLEDFVSGPYDIIAKIDAATTDELGKKIATKIQPVQGVLKTLTCMVVNL